MDRLERLKEFFKVDVNNVIPAMVQEYAEISGCYNDDEINDILKESMFKNLAETESAFCCSFMTEPYIRIYINNDIYGIKVEDQCNVRINFISRDFEAFKRFWNTDVINYFGQDVKFPEINF